MKRSIVCLAAVQTAKQSKGEQMHFYQHHIGDFIKDTSFLTNEELGIYSKLIWIYYDTEQPLPDQVEMLAIKVGERDHPEKVGRLLNLFFKLRDGVWWHGRCNSEISVYQQFLGTRAVAGKASAAKRQANKTPTEPQHPGNTCSTDVQHVFNTCSTRVQHVSN